MAAWLVSRRELLEGIAAGGLAAVLPGIARAAPAPAALDDAAKADVARIVAFLNNIHTMETPFQQTAADGAVSSGMLYVERPGKLRLVYNPPVPVMIIADGRGIYYWDSKLQQLSETRVEDTPAWFLLRPDITTTGDVTITGFERQSGVLRLTMVEAAHPDLGNVTLVFSDNPLELRQWTIVDAQGRPVTVSLTDPRYGMAISPLMFDWIDPRTAQGRVPH